MLFDQLLPNLLSGAKELTGLCLGQRVQAAPVNYHNPHGWAQLLWTFHCLLTPEPPFCLPRGPRLASVWVTLPYPSSPTAGPLALDMGRREAWEATLQAIFLYLATWYLQVYLDGLFSVWYVTQTSNKTRAHALSLYSNFPREESGHIYLAISLLSPFFSTPHVLYIIISELEKGRFLPSSSALSAPS